MHLGLLALLASCLSARQGDVEQALMGLYNATHGGGWLRNEGWGKENDICTWYGVTCTGGLVAGLSLDSNNLMGSIPGSFEVGTLSTLDLGSNSLHGTLPCTLFTENLTSIKLSSNAISGTVPTCLESASSLVLIEFDSNSLRGQLPEMSGMSKLAGLYISWNELEGTLPKGLMTLTALQGIFLDGNKIQGTLPSFRMCESLYHLWLDNNRLSGTIPDDVASPVMTELELQGNLLRGLVPVLPFKNFHKCDLGNGYDCPLPSNVCKQGCKCSALCTDTCDFWDDCNLDGSAPMLLCAACVGSMLLAFLTRWLTTHDTTASTASCTSHQSTASNTTPPVTPQLPDLAALRPGRWRLSLGNDWDVDVRVKVKDKPFRPAT
eukprot:TRINITY_DN13022_c0_g1_i1.p1 TRINITY_DN13022_c0_g1~~TRINITY_DN13022_c0_g1_i1.p1  ORF type:complete len:378 (+),score=56.45 TRINITY_DN13022_c0_g1_i1:358-1491(+)